MTIRPTLQPATRTDANRLPLAHLMRNCRSHLRSVGIAVATTARETDWVSNTPGLDTAAAADIPTPYGLAQLYLRLALAPMERFVVEILLATRIDPAMSEALGTELPAPRAHATNPSEGWVGAEVLRGLALCRDRQEERALGRALGALEQNALVDVVDAGPERGGVHVRLRDRVAALALGQLALDGALVGAAVRGPAAPPVERPCTMSSRELSALIQMTRGATRVGSLASVALCGPAGAGKTHMVAHLADESGAIVLAIDAVGASTTSMASTMAARLADALAWCRIHEAWLVVDRAEALAEHPQLIAVLRRALREANCPVFVLSRDDGPQAALQADLICAIHLERPSVEQGAPLWTELVARRGLTLDPAAATELGGLASLLPGEIDRAIQEALLRNAASANTASPLAERLGEVLEHRFGARPLGRLARPIDVPGASLDRLVLPESTAAELTRLTDAIRARGRVLEQWGFASHIAAASSLVALFAGPPGTGKTFAAAAVAADLGRRLLAVNVAELNSKWIGETEKHITELFRLASTTTGILLIDEADALFSRRVDVEKAADKHANAVTNVLLHELERFSGVALLTTNNHTVIDEAFRRRLAMIVHFDRPAAPEREELWRRSVPPPCPLADDVDWSRLAHRYELSGGEIKNALVTAAYAAATADRPVRQADLVAAIEREFSKAGRLFPG